MDQKKVIEVLGFWVVNAIVLLLASLIFRDNIVLGNDKVSTPMAAVLAGLVITGLTYLVRPIVAKSGLKVKGEYNWGIVYLVANTLIVWVIKRLALVLGLGVANIFFTLILAVLLTVGQWAVAKVTGATKG